jgi:transposase
MVSKRRSFTREFKIETVQMLTHTDVSVPQAAADLGIHPNTLYRWVQQYW